MKRVFLSRIAAVIVITSAMLGISLVGCAQEVVEMTVDHYKQPCQGMAKFLCKRVDEGSGFQNFYDSIGGFDFEWGYTYRLRVRKKEIRNPPMDGSSVEYHLEKVLEKTPVALGTTFEMPVEPGSQPELDVSNSQNGTLMDETPFVCESQDVCSQISDALEQGEIFSVEFGYITTGEAISLVAMTISI